MSGETPQPHGYFVVHCKKAEKEKDNWRDRRIKANNIYGKYCSLLKKEGRGKKVLKWMKYTYIYIYMHILCTCILLQHYSKHTVFLREGWGKHNIYSKDSEFTITNVTICFYLSIQCINIFSQTCSRDPPSYPPINLLIFGISEGCIHVSSHIFQMWCSPLLTTFQVSMWCAVE